MIINTGNRTDIPGYYSKWFYQRIKEGFVLSRSPYAPNKVYRYNLDPSVVDCLVFCTKNPHPMLKEIELLKEYRQYWMVTITPYTKEIEPNVPNKNEVIRSFIALSKKIGKECIAWRYDPIFLNDKYTLDYHISIFEQMAQKLAPYTNVCIISFIDLYEKTKKNFQEVQEVSIDQQYQLVEAMSHIAKKYHITLKTCAEHNDFSMYQVDQLGCLTQETLEQALHVNFKLPHLTNARSTCKCLLGNDIGSYNSCLHGCRYCYANYEFKLVQKNYQLHDPYSPLLIGHLSKEDTIQIVNQVTWINPQLTLF